MLFRASRSAARSSAAFTVAAARSASLICACSNSANFSAAVLFSLARCSHFLASAFQSVSCAGASAGGSSFVGVAAVALSATSAGVGVLVPDMVFPSRAGQAAHAGHQKGPPCGRPHTSSPSARDGCEPERGAHQATPAPSHHQQQHAHATCPYAQKPHTPQREPL